MTQKNRKWSSPPIGTAASPEVSASLSHARNKFYSEEHIRQILSRSIPKQKHHIHLLNTFCDLSRVAQFAVPQLIPTIMIPLLMVVCFSEAALLLNPAGLRGSNVARLISDLTSMDDTILIGREDNVIKRQTASSSLPAYYEPGDKIKSSGNDENTRLRSLSMSLGNDGHSFTRDGQPISTTKDLASLMNNSAAAVVESMNNTTENFQIGSETERYILMVNLVAEIAVLFIGLIGNGIVIAIILFFTKGNSVADVYIFNLAIADMTFLAGLGFLLITSINDDWVFGNIVCKIVMSLTALNQFASSLLLSLMSFDRYLAVCHPIFSQRYRHQKPAKLICFILWILCFVLMIPIFIYARTDEDNKTCGMFWPDYGMHERVFTLYSFCIGFLLPLVLIVVFYRCVVIKLKSTASGPMSMMNSERRTRSRESTNKRVSNLVKAIVATYGACWLPYWIGQIMVGFSPSMSNNTFNQVAACLSYLNSAINPILYAFLSDSFRRRCSQFWQSVHSSRLFKRNLHDLNHQTAATLTSLVDHPNNENNIHCSNNNDDAETTITNNNNTRSINHQPRTTTLTGSKFDSAKEIIALSTGQESAMQSRAESGLCLTKIDTSEIDSRYLTGSATEVGKKTCPTSKNKADVHLLSFKKLKKFQRSSKKKHSLVRLNQMSCKTNNGSLIGQTVLLA